MKRKDSSSSEAESDCVEGEPIRLPTAMDDEAGGSGGPVRTFKPRPSKRPHGSRNPMEDYSAMKNRKFREFRELTMRAEVALNEARAAAAVREAEILEERNMLMLFTTPDHKITGPDGIEWLRLRRLQETKKLMKKLEALRALAS